MEEKNYTGEKFLDKLYKDLFNSEIVEHTKEKSDSREEAIKKYMDRLEKAHQNATTENRKERLKRLYYDKYIIKEENMPNNLSILQKEQTIENQKSSLDKWLDYLTDENTRYPMWAKYWVFQGMLKMGTYDEAHEVYQNRSEKTSAPFVECNPEIIAKAIEILQKQLNKETINDDELKKLIATGSFSKIYAVLEEKYKKNISINSDSKDGIWIKYNKGSKEEAIKLAESIEGKNTHWCTASKNTAIEQVCGGENYQGGDFYVYYTKDNENNYTNPRIAIRMEGKNSIGEIRGIEESQNMEECMIPILEEKLKTLQFLKQTDVDKNLSIIDDLKKLTEINKKTTQKTPLTLEETIDLYSKEYGFGWEQDPRVKKIQKKRNIKEDLKILNKITNREIAIETINKLKGIIVFGFFNSELKKDKEVVLAAVRKNYEALKYVDENLRKDKEFMLEAVNQEGFALQYADENLKKDKEIVMTALKTSIDSLMFADESLKKDKEFISELVKINGHTFRYADESLKKDKEFVLKLLKEDEYVIMYADKSLKKDKEVVKNAIKHQALLFGFADESLKKDKEFVLEVVKENGIALSNVDESLKKDKEIVMTALKQDRVSLNYADESLQKDKEFMLEAIKQAKYPLILVDEELKKDQEFMEQVRIIIEQQEKKEKHI